MSRIVTGYLNGKPQYRDDGPGRGRVAGYGQGNLHSLTLIGGSFVEGESGDPRREANREAAQRYREARR